MRRIMCFGDSNTYGHAPDGTRYDESLSWPGVLANLLGDRFEVVAEGQNGRTVAYDDPYLPGCNGMRDIEDCLERHEPLDLIIIMLGTNDLKKHFEATPKDIGNNLLEMCKLVQSKSDARIVLASPMLLGDQIEFSPLHLEFGRQAVDYSFEIAPETEKVAKEVGAEFIDMALVAVVSDVDCLHLVPEEHAKVAQAMYGKVMSIFGEELEQEAEEEEEARRKAEEEEEARRKAEEEEEARLKVEAILKAAEEEVAKEAAEKEAASALNESSFVVLEEEEEVPLVSEVLASRNTMSEKEKMLSGKLYKCDSELRTDMAEARKLTAAYNQTTNSDLVRRSEILDSLFKTVGKNAYIEPPFRCDYGSNISIGDNFYANFDCIMLDVGNIKIGDNVFLGPRVNVYTACHPVYAPVRNELLEYSKEVTIGNDVWVGGNVTINPGVHIGNNVVIGSGAVVTKDIPDGVVAAGNPCRILRRISEEDKEFWQDKKAEYDEK